MLYLDLMIAVLILGIGGPLAVFIKEKIDAKKLDYYWKTNQFDN